MTSIELLRRSRSLLKVTLLAASAVSSAQAQSASSLRPTGFPAKCEPGEIEVLVLGTYHFANPGLDAIKMKTVDVFLPKRQREIVDLAKRLAAWKPDQIAIEWSWNSTDSTAARYARFKLDSLDSRNEVAQIGFRVAKMLGHDAVYPIDQRVRYGNDSLDALVARRADLREHQQKELAAGQKEQAVEDEWREKTTIVQHLAAMNSEKALHGGNSAFTFGIFLPMGEGTNLGGPDLVAGWYQRNIYMTYRLLNVLKPGTKRVLLIVGAGHAAPLRNLLDEAPQFCPVSPLPLLR